DQDNAVLRTLIDGTRGTRRRTGRIQAVFADPWQIEHKRLLELELDLVRALSEDRIILEQLRGAAAIIVPDCAPTHLGVLTADQRRRPRDRSVLLQWSIGEILVVVGPRLIVVVDRRHLRAGKDRCQDAQSAALFQLQSSSPVQPPAALPALLILI